MRQRLQIVLFGLAVIFGGGALIGNGVLLGDGAAIAQQLGEGMDRIGIVEFHSDEERQLFPALICMCGCPREALDTCTCGYAHARRAELRAELAKGKSIEQIKEEYAARFGTNALSVPPNTGANRLLYLLPIAAILLGAGAVVITLRRWRRRSDETQRERDALKKKGKGKGKGKASDKPDEYDDRLKQELSDLDGDDE
jgi:cytochrome c-type biogenesis protein CcmH